MWDPAEPPAATGFTGPCDSPQRAQLAAGAYVARREAFIALVAECGPPGRSWLGRLDSFGFVRWIPMSGWGHG